MQTESILYMMPKKLMDKLMYMMRDCLPMPSDSHTGFIASWEVQ